MVSIIGLGGALGRELGLVCWFVCDQWGYGKWEVFDTLMYHWGYKVFQKGIKFPVFNVVLCQNLSDSVRW